jgi:hypothetical protein
LHDVVRSPVLDIMPLDNVVMRRRSAWEPVIRRHIMLPPHTKSLSDPSMAHCQTREEKLAGHAAEILVKHNLLI